MTDLPTLVKPLVWEANEGGTDYRADRYIIQVFFGSDSYCFETWDLSLGRKLYDGDDLQSAQAAAQADYAARILAALDPDAVAKIREDALREAAEIVINDAGELDHPSTHYTFGRLAEKILALIDKKDAAK